MSLWGPSASAPNSIHAAIADQGLYITPPDDAPLPRTAHTRGHDAPSTTSTAESGGHVADGGSYGGGATCG